MIKWKAKVKVSMVQDLNIIGTVVAIQKCWLQSWTKNENCNITNEMITYFLIIIYILCYPNIITSIFDYFFIR